MLEKVRIALTQSCRLDNAKPVLVAVSGGPDSLCLLDVLWRLGYLVIVAHLDHGLRTESREEAGLVKTLTQRMDVQFILGEQDVAEYASRNGISIEEAARNVRYDFLFRQAEQHHAQAVAVGHTANDQVETVLMHLLRGSGMAGLRGMEVHRLPHAWSTTIPLVRPLLGVWRYEILEYLSQVGLQPIWDASNQDRRFYRNRLRQELLPYLESINPGAGQRIWRMSQLIGEDELVLEACVDCAWAECCCEAGGDFVAFDARRMQSQPLAIQRRLVRRGIAYLRRNLRDIDYAAVERALTFLHSPGRSSRTDLIAGLRLEMQQGCLWLADWRVELPGTEWPQLAPGSQLLFDLPGELQLPGGWRLQGEIVKMDEQVSQQAMSNPDPFQAWLDFERLDNPLRVRTRLPGDRFQPLGMDGHSLKLSDYMLNRKLPRRARQDWPLVLSGEQIVWLPGFHPGHAASIQDSTLTAAHLQLSREGQSA